ncbi:hypothetical protein LG296_20735 (plasmid) [Ureibacillus chungkukjangi]|uniref:hypothetical protein n=1 Tax=Ureibacillus chungkukjangi TaxID=1202712 RepID=UPI000D3BBAEA|nr:hypothetical protein [Ureibacillus chungkukjangi]
MLFEVLLVISAVMTMISLGLVVNHERKTNDSASQDVGVENWALTHVKQGNFMTLNHEENVNEVKVSSVEQVTPTMSYENEAVIDPAVENFFNDLTMISNENNSIENNRMVSDYPMFEPEMVSDERYNYEPEMLFRTDYLEDTDNVSFIYENEMFPVDEKSEVTNEVKEEEASTLSIEEIHYALRGQIDEAASKLEPVVPFKEYEPTLLSTEDWYNTEADYTVRIDPLLMNLADCRIADGQLGYQTWTAMIVGMESEYLHIADGTARTWINVENFMNKSFYNGDVIFIEVERQQDGLHVQTLNILQRSSDSESDCLHQENQFYNDGYTYEEVEIYVS